MVLFETPPCKTCRVGVSSDSRRPISRRCCVKLFGSSMSIMWSGDLKYCSIRFILDGLFAVETRNTGPRRYCERKPKKRVLPTVPENVLKAMKKLNYHPSA